MLFKHESNFKGVKTGQLKSQTDTLKDVQDLISKLKTEREMAKVKKELWKNEGETPRKHISHMFLESDAHREDLKINEHKLNDLLFRQNCLKVQLASEPEQVQEELLENPNGATGQGGRRSISIASEYMLQSRI